MIFKITRALPLLLAAVFLSLGFSVYAAEAESPPPRSETLDALHGGTPPTQPTNTTTPEQEAITPPPAAPNGGFAPLPTPAPDLSAETSESEPSAPPLYPSDVSGALENGTRWILKIYELSENENPETIPREGFTRDGWRYELADILKKETAASDVREHIQTVTVGAESKDMADILPRLSQTLNYTSEDGYAGTLELDIASITVETAGTRNESFTASATREYPHLSSNDVSLVPKTVTDNSGRTLTLQSVDWRAGNTETVDYNALPEHYTAVATYTRTGTKTVVTGYVVTAEYKGELAKLISGKTVYTAYFEGTEISPTPEITPEPAPEPERETLNPLPVVGAIAGLALLGGAAYFFFFRKNVKVHNLKDGKYVPIGNTRTTARNPVINLTPFSDKAMSGSFILVLDALAAKSLSGKVVAVNYGDRSFQHIIDGGGGEYRFEIDF
jgi:hypothetical protein